MKLVTFEAGSGLRTGAVVGDALVDLTAAGLPAGMIDLIAQWPRLAEKARSLAATIKPEFKLSQVRLHAPVPNPQKILAIGLNYADHIEETGLPKPERQTWFSKLPNAVNGPYDAIQIPKVSSAVDYEAEFVAIVGRRCRHVASADAASAVFGYAAGNDVSVRDWQFHTPQWLVGKSFDTHAPIGPWIVTADEMGEPYQMRMTAKINGEIWSDSSEHLVKMSVDEPRLRSKIVSDTEAEGMLDGHAICMSAADPDSVILAVRMGLFRSKNQGKTWEDMRVDRFSPFTYGRDIKVSPQDPNTLYACLSVAAASKDGALYRSRDIGRTWQRFDKVQPHGTLMSVSLHYSDPKQVYIAARYGEVFGTQDGGESWREMPLPQGVQHIYALACG